jgi:DNA helicase-2/ATP-dependent DNA helicase PcrA
MLPGEAVRECVDRMNQGILDPVALLGIQHLIVDEYQDLNPVDVEFIDLMAARGTELFVCGDDDQSIYSFRYGSPVGIQGFTTRHGSATSHILTDCFRSTQNVFSSAQALLAAFAAPTRIPKTQVSAYASSAPPEPGVVHRWKFQAGNLEAQAIAESCRSLIGSGVPASEIMILFSNKRDLAREVEGALNTLAIPFNSVKQDLISSTPTGRFVGALLRAVTDPDDYLAVRTMLGMSKGVGAKSCAGIREKTHLNHLNFRQLLTGVAVPSGIFTTRESRSIALVQSYWQQVQGWQGTDSIAMHQTAIGNILLQAFKDQAMKSNWDSIQFPPGMTLGDTLDLFCSRTEEEEQEVLKDVAARLGQVPSIAAQPDKVKCMTLHTSKGLSARVVFIPGLEQELLPGRHRMPYPGQIEEAARLLYVGVTRARAACIVSYSERRWVNGASTVHTPSTFCASLGGPFVPRANGLTNNEVNHVNAVINNL